MNNPDHRTYGQRRAQLVVPIASLEGGIARQAAYAARKDPETKHYRKIVSEINKMKIELAEARENLRKWDLKNPKPEPEPVIVPDPPSLAHARPPEKEFIRVPCKKCGAPEGSQCVGVNGLSTDTYVRTRKGKSQIKPHKARVDAYLEQYMKEK